MRRLRLQLGPGARTACGVLQLVPLPGAGAMYAGWRNPHTRLLRNGAVQALLVVTGTWPLVVPGAIGFAWAAVDSVRIFQADLAPLPPKPPQPEKSAKPAKPAKPARTADAKEAR